MTDWKCTPEDVARARLKLEKEENARLRKVVELARAHVDGCWASHYDCGTGCRYDELEKALAALQGEARMTPEERALKVYQESIRLPGACPWPIKYKLDCIASAIRSAMEDARKEALNENVDAILAAAREARIQAFEEAGRQDLANACRRALATPEKP